jgi:hypothetical protein
MILEMMEILKAKMSGYYFHTSHLKIKARSKLTEQVQESHSFLEPYQRLGRKEKVYMKETRVKILIVLIE